MLDLLRPIYQKTASYGHFGRNEPEFSWEHTDKAAQLAADAGTKAVATVVRDNLRTSTRTKKQEFKNYL